MRNLRLGVLVFLLCATILWAAGVHHRHAVRTEWRHTLEVAVVLLAHHAQPDPTSWKSGLERLEGWIGSEMARYRDVDHPPVHFSLYGPIAVELAPKFLPDDDGLLTRAAHAFSLRRALSALDERARVGRAQVRVYVFLDPENRTPTVEGAGEVGGDAGFVRATLDPDLSMALTAVAHELFHCLGATDHYDADGHAVVPDGLAEPERGLPQRFAEVMVGEVPLQPGKGRLPLSLDEVRVGEVTARELRWSLTPTGR